MRKTAWIALVLVAVAAAALALPAAAEGPPLPKWRLVHSGGDADLRALGPVSGRVAWASGSGGTVLRTTDRGRTWESVGPPGTEELEFRGIEAFDKDHALLMSVGETPASFRVYRTADGGDHWRITNQNRNPQAFYDCMAFFDDGRHGLVMSDPVGGRFRILRTADGGRSWHIVSPANMPPAREGEFGFAASDTCITTFGDRHAWFGTGGPGGGRVFRSSDGGRTWQASQTPIRRNDSSGVFAVAFRTSLQGLAIGGDFLVPDRAPRALALTADGGATWTLVGDAAAPGEYRSGAAWVPGTAGTAIAVGLTGSDVSTDGGFSWRRFDDGTFDAVVCTPRRACWASGDEERIAKLVRP